MRKGKEIVVFILVSMLVIVGIYGDALIGRSILAPLDIGPDVFEHYSFMDEEADGIPDNHFISDQFVYDLPLQKVIRDAYDQGEIPWWDPYTYGGRPLLADAHINGTDPVRLLCHALLPFELAYNWNFVVRGLLIGLGMFLLLRTLKVRFAFSVVLGIVHSYAGWFLLFFGHPWIAGAFLYYPYLWLVWFHLSPTKPRLAVGVGGLLCAGVFFAGNLQSHIYLPTFAFLLLLGKGLSDRIIPWRLTGVVAATGVIGVLLASAVLGNQVEFFLSNERPVKEMVSYPASLLNAPFLATSVFPWGTGTFRTLNVGSMFGSTMISYVLFAGSAVTLLMFLGLVKLQRKSLEHEVGNYAVMACRILLLWFVVMAISPFLKYYYLRSSALAGMAVIVVAGMTLEGICAGKIKLSHRFLKWSGAVAAALVVLLQISAFIIYPRFAPRVEELVMKSIPSKPGDLLMPALRQFQLKNFTNEISFLNPETVVSVVAITFFFVALSIGEKYRSRLLLLMLIISSVPLLSYYKRYRPKHDVVLWERLLEGGPSQKDVIKATAGGRRYDEADTVNSMVLPFAYPAFYQVHAVRGYSALQPESIVKLRGKVEIPFDWQADIVKTSEPGEQLVLSKTSEGARFRNQSGGGAANVRLEQIGLNGISIEILEGEDVNLVRTDTHYPGWSVVDGGAASISEAPPCFTKLTNVSDNIVMKYRPTFLSYSPYLVLAGLLITVFLFSISLWKRYGPSNQALSVSEE